MDEAPTIFGDIMHYSRDFLLVGKKKAATEQGSCANQCAFHRSKIHTQGNPVIHILAS